MKNNYMMPMIFGLVLHFVKYHKDNHFRIQNVEKSIINHEYVITFFSPKKKRILVQPASKIIQNAALINELDPLDAAMIGMYAAETHYEKLYINKNNLNNLN